MSAFDYDVIVIWSGFGGSVAALRATEKGTAPESTPASATRRTPSTNVNELSSPG